MSSLLVDQHLPSLEVEGAIAAFDRISQNLLAGYQELAQRARRVEDELSLRNAELAERIAELDAVKRHLEAILESLPTGVVVRDPSGVIVRVNPAAARIANAPMEQLLGEKELPDIEPLSACTDAWIESRLQRPDDREFVLARRVSKITSTPSVSLGTVEILDDRTELARITARMQMQEKMAALGTMAGGIAHEIRNPLNAVKGFASLLCRGTAIGTKESRWAERIQQGVNEVDAIISGLLSLAQPERLRIEQIKLSELIHEALDLALGEGPREPWQIAVNCTVSDLRADRIQLRQALRNLIANAMEAQGTCGVIAIDAQCQNHEITISVSDAGPGIPLDLASKVMEPFFTTRADGTGLGLAIVHSVLRLHGGRLEIAQEPSSFGGATIRLRIPLASSS